MGKSLLKNILDVLPEQVDCSRSLRTTHTNKRWVDYFDFYVIINSFELGLILLAG